jgi:RND family efflux transporter MFP subunit
VSTACRATLVQGISSSGLLRPSRVVDVTPRVSGEVVAAGGYEGREVSRGEVLATIDDSEFRLAYERASTALLGAQIEYRTQSASPFLQTIDTMRARLDLEAAREYYQRVRTAYAAGRIDGSALYRARRAYEATRAYASANREDVIENRSGLAFAREAYERAKRELEATKVRAPIEGRIASWNIAAGMQTRAGQPICSVVDMSRILIEADIVEADAGKIHAGARADISCLALPGIRFSGTVRAVSPVIDMQTRMMRATVELFRQSASRALGQGLLRPGMFATVMIETDRLEGRLLVPREALLVRDLRQLVFTMENGQAKWHYVETGQENRESVEIRSGLCEGDTVIVDGHYALAHNARVCIKD